MSIAEELEALNTNLAAAKAAVTAAGGTVADTGLAGLATEIATIPGGGPAPDPVSDYGVIRLYDYRIGAVDFNEYIDVMNPVSLWIDQDQFATFCETNNINIPLDNQMHEYLSGWGTWPNDFNLNWYPMDGGEPYQGQWSSKTDFEAETGIYFVAPDGASLSPMIGLGAVINPSGPTTDIVISSQNDLNALCATDYSSGGGMGRGERILTINGNQVPAGAVKAFYFGTQNVAPSGAYFLAGCKNMTYLSPIPSRMSGTESPFVDAYSLKRLDFDEGAFTFRGWGFSQLPSLEEIHVGNTTTIASTNDRGQYVAGGTPTCASSLYNVASTGYLKPKTIRIYGGNRAAIISAWGKTYYEQYQAWMRFVEDGGA